MIQYLAIHPNELNRFGSLYVGSTMLKVKCSLLNQGQSHSVRMLKPIFGEHNDVNPIER